jgi:hypothetical protein
MANIIVSVSEPTINVDSTNNTVNVSTTTSNVSVSNISVVSNSQIRQGISVSNLGGFGNLAYDNSASSNGVIQYTGVSNSDIYSTITTTNVSGYGNIAFDQTNGDIEYTGVAQSDIRGSISNVGAINYDTGTGEIGVDGAAIFTARSTDDLSEGVTNLYFSNTRVRSNISVTDAGGDGSLAYDNTTGVFTYTGPSQAEVLAHFSNVSPINLEANGQISVDESAIFSGKTTDDLTEGTTNLYFTPARVRSNISLTTNSPSGNGSLTYDNSTGVFDFTPAATNSLTNADVKTFIEANGLDASANLTTTANTSAAHGTFTGATSLTATGNVSIGGNLDVTGNINSETVVDLFVEDRNITLQYGTVGSPSANSQVFVDRGSSANTYIKWDEGSDSWKFSNDGSTEYKIPTSTSDLAEGTNLYFTAARARGNISVTDSGGDGSLAYDSGTGVITYTGPSAAETRAHISVTDAGGLGSAAYDSGTGVITYTGPADSDVRGLVSTTTTSASGGGSLAYDSGTGVFTFAPADLSSTVSLTDFSVTTGTTTSGNSSLAYDNTSGVFTFKPVDIEVLTGVDYGSTPTGNPTGTIDYKTRSISNVSAIQGSNTGSFLELAGNITSYAAGAPHYIHYDYVRSKLSMLTNSIAFDAGTAGTDDGIINLANGVLSSSVFTALQSDNAQANIDNFGNINATYFHGDGSNITNVTSDVTSENIVRVCIAGEDIAKGDAVYISGGTGDNPEVSKADADDAAKMPAFGIAKEAISSSSTGNVVIYGEITSYDTTSFTTGDSLFVSTTPGSLTNSAPTGESSLLQKIGKVIKGGSPGGKITVTGAGRTNATPNLNDGNIFIGNASNQATTAVFADELLAYDGNSSISNLTALSNVFMPSTVGSQNSGRSARVQPVFFNGSNVEPQSSIPLTRYGLNKQSLSGYQVYGPAMDASHDVEMQDKLVPIWTFKTSDNITTDTTDAWGMYFEWPDGNSSGTGNLLLAKPSTYSGGFLNNTQFVVDYHQTVEGRLTANSDLYAESNVNLKGNVYVSATGGSLDANLFVTESTDGNGANVRNVKSLEVDAISGRSAFGNTIAISTSNLTINSNIINNTTTMADTDYTSIITEQRGHYNQTVYGTPFSDLGITQSASANTELSATYVGGVLAGPSGDNFPADGTITTTAGSNVVQLTGLSTVDTDGTPFTFGFFYTPNGKTAADVATHFTSNMMLIGCIGDDAMCGFPENTVISSIANSDVGGNANIVMSNNAVESISRTLSDNSVGGQEYVGIFHSAVDSDGNRFALTGYNWSADSLSRYAINGAIFPGRIGYNLPPDYANLFSTFNSITITDIDAQVTASDYSINASTAYGSSGKAVRASQLQTPDGFLNLKNGLTIGANTGMGARMNYREGIPNFGINIKYPGTTEFRNEFNQGSSSIQAGMNFFSHVDNSVQAGGGTLTSRGGPRIMLGSLYGNENDPISHHYPRENYEIGKYAWFGPTKDDGYQQSTTLPPAFITGTAGSDWTSAQDMDIRHIARGSDGTLRSFLGYVDANTYIGSNEIISLGEGPGITSNIVSQASSLTSEWANVSSTGIQTSGIVTATGNVSGGNVTTTGITSTGSLTATGNVSGGNVTTTGAVQGDNTVLKKFNETVVALGDQSGDISSSLNANTGTIFTVTATGGITINSIANAVAGTSATIKITQDGTGSHALTSSFKFAGGNSTLSTGASNIDVISVVYDGTDYLASLTNDYK